MCTRFAGWVLCHTAARALPLPLQAHPIHSPCASWPQTLEANDEQAAASLQQDGKMGLLHYWPEPTRSLVKRGTAYSLSKEQVRILQVRYMTLPCVTCQAASQALSRRAARFCCAPHTPHVAHLHGLPHPLPVFLMWCSRDLFGFACLPYVVPQTFIWLCLSSVCGAPEIYLALPVYLMRCSRDLFGFACLPYVVLQTFIWLCLSSLCGAPDIYLALPVYLMWCSSDTSCLP